MRDFQLEKTGRRARLGRVLLLHQPRGTLLLKSQQDHPLVKGCSGEPPSTPQLTLSSPFSHLQPNGVPYWTVSSLRAGGTLVSITLCSAF